MKNGKIKRRFFAIVLMIFLLLQNCMTIHAEDTGKYEFSMNIENWKTEKGYKYPLKPTDDEWAEMSYAEQVASCNMPQELVDVLSTEELVNVTVKH